MLFFNNPKFNNIEFKQTYSTLVKWLEGPTLSISYNKSFLFTQALDDLSFIFL